MTIFRTVSENEFVWWKVFGWLGLIVGDLGILENMIKFIQLSLGDDVKRRIYIVFGVLFLVNSILMILVLKFNKWAFFIATILSFNPLLWIINGIYLKNRWCHPKVNKGKTCGKYAEEEVLNKFKENMK